MMKFIFRVLIIFLFPVYSALANDSELNAGQWLEKMSVSMKTLNYQGTVAFFKNGRLDTMKYAHSKNQSIEQERLSSLNSPMREMVRDAGKVSCVFEKSKKIVVNHRPVSKSFIIDLPINFLALNAVYDFSLGDEEMVAMRSTRIILIQPKDHYRYLRKIWIDKEYFLPLKVEVYNLSGEILKQVMFTDIHVVEKLAFRKINNSLDNSNIKHIHLLETSSIEESSLEMNNLPAEFETVFFTQMNIGDSDKKVDHLLLSDGFSSVSIYREDKSDDVQLGSKTLGSVNSYTLVIGGSQITAMGDVPVKAVQLIAQSVTLQ